MFDFSEIEALREELSSERDARLRLAAEYENYRRRTIEARRLAADEGKRELLEQMLIVGDDLDLALANLSEAPEWVVEAVHMIHRRFHAILEANGVVGMKSVGEAFDPKHHEAFDVRPDTEYGVGTVHTDLRRGYFLNGKLLRPALVIVAQ
jgi:molecular chaperone GrpE